MDDDGPDGGRPEDDVVVGMTSFGWGCGYPNYPGVYTRLAPNAAWIRSQLCETSAYPPDYCGVPTTVPSTSLSPTRSANPSLSVTPTVGPILQVVELDGFGPNPQYPYCSVCGTGSVVTNPNNQIRPLYSGVTEETGEETASCLAFQVAGYVGYLEPTFCTVAKHLAADCGCS